MTLGPIEQRIPLPRGNPDEYAAGAALWSAEAAITADIQRAREAAIPRTPGGRRTPPANKRRSDPLLIAWVALIVSVMVNVVLVEMRLSDHPPAKPPAVDIANSAAQADLYNIGHAELTYYNAHGVYTTDPAALGAVGYQPIANTAVILSVGVADGQNFCAVTGNALGSPWYRYDTTVGGLVNDSYPSESAAQLACSDHETMGFATIT